MSPWPYSLESHVPDRPRKYALNGLVTMLWTVSLGF
jgi:hypothetical protein